MLWSTQFIHIIIFKNVFFNHVNKPPATVIRRGLLYLDIYLTQCECDLECIQQVTIFQSLLSSVARAPSKNKSTRSMKTEKQLGFEKDAQST